MKRSNDMPFFQQLNVIILVHRTIQIQSIAWEISSFPRICKSANHDSIYTSHTYTELESDFTAVQNFQKGPFPANMAMIGQKIGFGPNWPHLATEGGAKWGPKVKISKIWLHHCSKLPKRSLPCEYGNDWAKNRIWPRLAPIGTFRGAKRGLRVDFYQIWLQISK